ncbi:MAG TPA: VCBS repeat-containing protein [Terriglobales bacterium]|nr:VCBS repeat-containing protein [Terriglobales bacterium]
MPGFSALLTFISLLALTLLGTPARAQFETRSSTPVSLFPTSIAVGDFNRDGKLDVAVGGNVLQVMLGNGDGTFRAPVTYISVSFAPTKTGTRTATLSITDDGGGSPQTVPLSGSGD